MSSVEAIYGAGDDAQMAEPLRVRTIECMRESGLDVDPRARNMRDFVEAAGKGPQVKRQTGMCIFRMALDLYPDQRFSVGY